MNIKDALKISSLPVLLSSLCCLTPVVLVLLGFSSASFAASLSDTLYGEFKWAFRGLGAITLLVALAYYVRRQKGICTIEDAVRRRSELINIVALSVIAGVLGYIFFLYVIVHYAGVFLRIWG